jgi:hypothetical protein
VLTAIGLVSLASVSRAAFPVSADDVQTSVVQQCSYTATSDAPRHKWVPYRPKQADNVDNDGPMLTAAQEPVAESTGSDPFTDPFGDGKAKGSSKAAPKTVPIRPMGKAAVEALSAEGTPNERMLQFPASAAPAPIKGSAVRAVPIKRLQQAPAADQSVDRGLPSDATKALEQELASVQLDQASQCPKSGDIKPINKINLNIKPDAEQAVKGQLPPECPLDKVAFVPRSWAQTDFAWTASALCHKPLYFEDLQTERYGHTWGPFLQPIFSAGHFFVNVPLLPYNMGVEPPGECIYTLGYYRPGSCAPYMLDPFPLSVRGALFEGGAATGLVFILP